MYRIHLFAFLLLLQLFGNQPLQAQSPHGEDEKNLAKTLGYPPNSRLLIIHADDFGMTHSVNSAIEEALENNWVTSASILVPCPWFPEVAQWARQHPDADLGIHLALNSEWTTYRWPPVSSQSKGSSLIDADGYLPLNTEDVVSHAKISDVLVETHAQIDKAKAAGIHISHLDDHMDTIVSSQDLLKTYLSASHEYQIPALLARDFHFFHIQLEPDDLVLDGVLEMAPGIPNSKWLAAYEQMLQSLKPGTYELIVHLGHDDSELQAATFDHPDWGAQWRQNDFDLVRSVAFRRFLKDQGFILISWRDILKSRHLHPL
jgi:predicted glycoside hydrolase/deacetylase ChbG (UPF0249 family)